MIDEKENLRIKVDWRKLYESSIWSAVSSA